METHFTESYSKENKRWFLGKSGWIGGQYIKSNLSGGYHGIQKQWWDYYTDKNKPLIKVLLVSESTNVKNEFIKDYPNWNIDLIDLYPELTKENTSDVIIGDICNMINPIIKKYDLIICQATLEHVYNPFQAMYNMSDSLENNGIMIIHTHPPGFQYHRFPSDYFRFMKDWWYDLGKYIQNIELLEFHMNKNNHVFTCYQKLVTSVT